MLGRAIVVVGVALLLLAGCSAAPAPQPTPPAIPSSIPRPAAASIGTHSSAVQPVRAETPPVRVQVPAAGIDVTVQPVGVGSDGLMELNDNPSIATWYRYGSDPLSPTGATVIAAHVDSLEYGLGPFAKLKDLPVGTQVVVTTVDGVLHSYAIASVQKILKQQLPIGQIFQRDGPRQLTLITCGGQFNYDTLHYSDNVVVTATPDQP